MKPGLDAAAVTVETAPDSGYRLRNEVEMNIDPNAPDFATKRPQRGRPHVPGRLGHGPGLGVPDLQRLPAGRIEEARHPKTWPGTSRPGSPGSSARLQSTGAGIARPMSAQELCEVVRIAYDPPAALIIDEAHAAGSPVVPDLGRSRPLRDAGELG